MSRAPASRTLKRKAQPTRGRKPAKKIGLMDKAVAALPVSEQTLRKTTGWSMFAVACAVLIAMASWLGIPGTIGTAVAESVGRAGFRVEQIEVTGLNRMERMTVYAVALDQRSRAMPLIDLSEVRSRLLDYPWIADARVSRRLPDTLVIDIVEREPVAIWQSQGQLMLIDVTGKPLEPVSPDAMPALPLVIGEGANEREPQYQALMQSAPALKSLVKAATWVGDRRWDLLFDSGERLALPEGEAAAAKALAKFAELDRTDRLLGKGYIRFDMRDASRMVLRMPSGSQSKAITGEGA
ncbi:FtsQ-type POTRA domain-containing protein [Sphingomonas donggukensis]|uniref:Cell division protein FtsQ n=1 Tax=Sphingomonas donggukensis TaxID=2949093 RepID=A0ABY4TWY2_9SPHN|nr:cell division protein FtsQ/DivIB [Sphingomonas donggukensis]URW76913.1 FtsQ-type POTRA domain-containing protein [Sphingomonas donggukensis]